MFKLPYSIILFMFVLFFFFNINKRSECWTWLPPESFFIQSLPSQARTGNCLRDSYGWTDAPGVLTPDILLQTCERPLSSLFPQIFTWRSSDLQGFVGLSGQLPYGYDRDHPGLHKDLTSHEFSRITQRDDGKIPAACWASPLWTV